MRTKMVNQMISWIGCKESNGSHKKIIDIYNSHLPLARNYKVKYTDAWCATTVSACAIATGLANIVPLECSCNRMIDLAKKMGIWVENDAFVPKPADIILYDWDDSGKGDCVGGSEHVGIVEKVVGSTITVIEGNKSDAVGRRTIKVNGRYIRGYICPKYDEVNPSPAPSPISKPNTNGALSKEEKWKGVVTASLLNVRTWAGVNNSTCSFSPLPKNAVVSVCDSVRDSKGADWYYINYQGKFGFVHSAYISQC